MFKFENTGKYNSIKEHKYKTATVCVFIFTAVVYIMLVLLMIITKFRILSPLIKFHDTIVYSYNDSGEVVKDPKYNSEYIQEQLQKEFESTPGLVLLPVCLTGAFIIIDQGLSLILTRKKGKFVFSDSVLGIMIGGILDGILILSALFPNLWLAFALMSEIGKLIEPSKIYGWLFLLPLLLLDGLFVSLYCKAAYYEENNYEENIKKSSQQRSNIVYCKKCGEPINNSAVLCEKCSNEDTIPESLGIHTENRFISTNKHQGITLITGLVYIIVGIITAIISANSYGVLFSQQLSNTKVFIISADIFRAILTKQLMNVEGFSLNLIVNLIVVIGYILEIVEVCICLFFGIGVILKKRWAALTVRAFMIIGVVVNVLLIVILFALKAFSIVPWLNIAYEVVVIVLTSTAARSLSDEPQRFCRKLQEREAGEFQK